MLPSSNRAAPAADRQPSLALVYAAYTSLAASSGFKGPAGLGGGLLYAGALDGAGGILLRAANIAGAASLAASADAAALRGAMRDGVIDFLVNSLEEALRILKNEIRKKQTVSVGVSLDPHRLVEQMLDRGVLPDILARSSQFPASMSEQAVEVFLSQGARSIALADTEAPAFATWSVDREFARWLPRLDACALAVIPEGDEIRRRWLKLAPRYLGRLAHQVHGVVLNAEELGRFRGAAEKLMADQSSAGQPTHAPVHHSILPS